MWMPMLLIDMPSGRCCGLTILLVVNGEPQVDLTTMLLEHNENPVLGVLIHSIEDLNKLEHYVIWSPAFQQLSEKIMAMDMARIVRSTAQ